MACVSSLPIHVALRARALILGLSILFILCPSVAFKIFLLAHYADLSSSF